MSLEKQPAAKSFETLTALPAFWSSSREELINPNLRISKSDSTFYNQASVETLYVSPSFKTFDPVKETVISKDRPKATQSSFVQMDAGNLKTLTTWVSTASEGTSSFSTLSMSSPNLASPEKSVHLLPPILAGPSFWTLSHQQSSAPVKEKAKTARVHHPFASRGLLFSDEEESDYLSLLEVLPDNSDSAKKKTSPISSSNWVEFSTQNVDHFTSISCSSFQATKDLPREPEANNSTNVLLGEVKNAIVRLHEDLSMVIQELNVISSHLVSLSGSSPQIGASSQFPKESSDRV
ncbi:ENTH domain-containing protein 1 [Camelus bactrianus]